jgi:hypothetical protein
MTHLDESYPAYCRERAAQCRRRADQAIARDVKAAFRNLEQMWLAAAEHADSSQRKQHDCAENEQQNDHGDRIVI